MAATDPATPGSSPDQQRPEQGPRLRGWARRVAVLGAALAAAGPIVACGSDGATLVVFERSGGLAGVMDHVVVDRTGEVTVTRGPTGPAHRFHLEPPALARLRSILGEAHVDELASYDVDGEARDAFGYHLRYAGRVVSWDDTRTPPTLAPALDELSGLVTTGS